MPFFYTNYKPHKESYQYPLKGIARCLTCTVHFSNRKSISIQVKEDLSIHAKAPFYAKPRDIETFIDAHSEWIYDKHTMLATKLAAKPRLSEAQQKHADTLERKFRKAAKEYILNSTAKYHGRVARTMYVPKMFTKNEVQIFDTLIKQLYGIFSKVIAEYI